MQEEITVTAAFLQGSGPPHVLERSITYLDFKVRSKMMFVPEVNIPFSVNGALLGCMSLCLFDRKAEDNR